MPAPAYSHRFGHTNTPQAIVWTCPLGSRAVVRSVSGVNARNDAVGYVVVQVAGIRVVQLYPAVGQMIQLEMRQVLYGGETVYMVTSHANIDIAVSGYLFADVAAATAAPGETREIPLPGSKPVELEVLDAWLANQ
jgi:hypothetical protein